MKALIKIALLVCVMLSCFNGLKAQILYEVNAPETGRSSFLLGTHHFAPLSAVDSIEELMPILLKVDKVYGEIDMQQMSDPVAMMGMQKVLLAPADSTLDKILKPAQLDSVKAIWTEYTGGTTPFEFVRIMKPSMITAQLVALMAQKALPNYNPQENIDMILQSRARQLGKPVAGLETMEFQMDLLYNQPISKQVESLMNTVRNSSEQAEKARELSEAYMAHNIDKILEMTIDADGEDPEMMQKLLYDRNDNWVGILTRLIPEESALVVVGAGHLPGEKGVLEGLRKAGFTVTPIE